MSEVFQYTTVVENRVAFTDLNNFLVSFKEINKMFLKFTPIYTCLPLINALHFTMSRPHTSHCIRQVKLVYVCTC